MELAGVAAIAGSVQKALFAVRDILVVFLAAVLQLVNTGLVLLHGDAGIWIGCDLWQLGRKMLWIVLFLWGVRLRAEGQGGVSPFHLSPRCIRGAGSVLFWWLGLLLIFLVWIAPGFFARHLPWANRASSSLNHRRLDDRESLRARTAWAQKKIQTSRCTNKSAEVGHLFVHSFFGTFHNAVRKKCLLGFLYFFFSVIFARVRACKFECPCTCTCLLNMFMI